MKVTITRLGAEHIPFVVLNNPLAYVDKCVHDSTGIWVFNYHGKAETGLVRMFQDTADIPDGDYTLPDKDWLIPETVDEGVDDDEF